MGFLKRPRKLDKANEENEMNGSGDTSIDMNDIELGHLVQTRLADDSTDKNRTIIT
jgi:hypothetical protein